jgi:predicted helicase
MMNATPLQQILHSFRTASVTEREKGTYFEELICLYLRNEPTYADLYSDVWMLSDVPPEFGISKADTGIDLVARMRGTGEFHAIQCKFYAEGYRVQKSDIDSFFTASGQKPFTHRIIVTTTNDWTDNAENSLFDQQPPVSCIDLQHLEDSQIDWTKYKPKAAAKLKPKFSPRKHQQRAIDAVLKGLKEADRGKLIMACGTGKTFTALKISELMAGKNKRVLFLVPSLALLSQTLTEWTHQSTTELHSFAVCSDAEVGKKREAHEDIVQTFAHELQYPATTDAARLAFEMTKRHDAEHMSVVFSTYHSINVIHRAQEKFGLAPFDLIVCDEAHRTTGATFENEDESEFVRVHDADYIRGAKRLYMTATPRVYGNAAKAKADQESIALCSMDDEALYGKQLHIITFSQAVEEQLLTDYKVIVLAVDEAHVNARLQKLLSDENNQLKVDDAARIVGCWKALSKQGLASDLSGDKSPMRKAVAFCQVIEPSTGKKQHKVSSKLISDMFQSVVDAYRETADDPASQLICEAAHVDGTMNATEKEAKINWLKAGTPDNVCRILSNVRCLSEGVDVPALDAVLFLSPRSSQVEVVQSVGRVMRKAPGKKLGYVILPVVIPHGMQPHDALNDNKVYKVVWEVLQALRSHDDRFDAFVNRLDLLGSPQNRMEVIAITDALAPKAKTSTPKPKPKDKAKGEFNLASGDTLAKGPVETQRTFQFQVGELEKALYAKLVKKCGNRMFWDDWANDIAKIAQTHIGRIHAILKSDDNAKEIKAFREFADELRDDLNDSITDDEVVEMLAQHLITKPVFDALFKDYSFASHNPVSQGMQKVLDLLNEHHLEKEADTLESFYASIRRRAEGIDNAEGKQKIVVELYDKFFRKAFPKMTERLGIVYTPVEVVDFIIHSINDLLQSEFGQTLGSKGVHILDPFTGTGTFITRLLQSGLIKPEELAHKYQHEIHANEIVLLAYYIAAINIEAVYHSLLAKNGDKAPQYQPFEGICLTDTFQMYEKEDLLSALMVDNSARRKRQKKLDIRVIMGNPPYSAKQESANDNNQNVAYPALDERISETYAARSTATLQNHLYDSYIRGIRWASDRIGKSGIIGFVTNAGWIDGRAADGLRKCLVDEFSSIYIFHLRGNQRTSGEQSRKEGGKIFGSGSRAPIAISLLVKNPQASAQGQIHFHDIGDYLATEQKLGIISDFRSLLGVTAANGWTAIQPDDRGDWLKQRDAGFEKHIVMGDKKTDQPVIFENYSSGVKTQRDAWCYNASRSQLEFNIRRTIDFYNSELKGLNATHPDCERTAREQAVEVYLSNDPTRISWTRGLRADVIKNKPVEFRTNASASCLYRPFTKQWLYFDRRLNEIVAQMPKIFPVSQARNFAIAVTGNGATDFSSLLVNEVHDLQVLFNGQCFPLYLYEKTNEEVEGRLFANPRVRSKDTDAYTLRDGISDAGLGHFQAAYPAKAEGATITKEDLFYYIYGLLHSPDYRSRFADNLSKELPRIPAVKQFADFMAFSKAGRELAHWHLNYETVDCFPAKIELTGGAAKLAALAPEQYRVVKMKHPKIKDPETGKNVNDRSTVIYNDFITVTGIPVDAYDYVVNGKAAIEWVMERQAVTTDKDSGIVNDANLWATETMNNPKYPLELLLRVITVSRETNRIVNGLPKLEID